MTIRWAYEGILLNFCFCGNNASVFCSFSLWKTSPFSRSICERCFLSLSLLHNRDISLTCLVNLFMSAVKPCVKTHVPKWKFQGWFTFLCTIFLYLIINLVPTTYDRREAFSTIQTIKINISVRHISYNPKWNVYTTLHISFCIMTVPHSA